MTVNSPTNGIHFKGVELAPFISFRLVPFKVGNRIKEKFTAALSGTEKRPTRYRRKEITVLGEQARSENVFAAKEIGLANEQNVKAVVLVEKNSMCSR